MNPSTNQPLPERIAYGPQLYYPLVQDLALRESHWRVEVKLQQDEPFSPKALELYFRTVCLPTSLVSRGPANFNIFVDPLTITAVNPLRDKELSDILDFATRAGVAAVGLYRRKQGTLRSDLADQREMARKHYVKVVQRLIEEDHTHLDAQDLRRLAIEATFDWQAGAPQADWPALLKEDARWCLAAPDDEWNDLMAQYPETVVYLEPFSVLCQLMPRKQALAQVWETIAAEEQLDLPSDINASGPY